MSEQTPDAISAAFREMEQADPEWRQQRSDSRPWCHDCGYVYWGPGSEHAPDCPWLRRKQKREKAEQKVRSIIDREVFKQLAVGLADTGIVT